MHPSKYEVIEAHKFYSSIKAEDASYRPHCTCTGRPYMIKDRDCFECLECGKKMKKDGTTIRKGR